MGTAKRPGRPWAEARGSCKEINDLVHILRGWLDASNVSVARLHRLLTPEHFGGSVPPLWRLREQLNGVGLTWDLAEAVADVCFPTETAQEAGMRLEQIRPLWIEAGTSPTPTRTDEAYDLVLTQQGTIAALGELNRVRQAFEVSEQARLQALQVATVLFALLGQTQAQVAQLTRQLDAIRASADFRPFEVLRAEGRLERAQNQTEDLRLQLARAEAERDRAQRIADVAARQITQLEEELRGLHPDVEHDAQAPAGAEVMLLDPVDATADDDAFDQVDAALQKARDVLNREHEAVREAAEDLGWVDEAKRGPDGRVIPGQVTEEEASPVNYRDGLFGTTPDNSPSSTDSSESPSSESTVDDGDHIRYGAQAEDPPVIEPGLFVPQTAFSLGDIMEHTLDEIEGIGLRSGEMTGVPTGFTNLDLLTNGMRPGQMIIIAAHPAMGKSTLALDFVRSCSIKHNLPSVIFSLEMARNEVAMRLLAAEARVALHHMRSGTMTDEDWTRLARRMPDVSSAPIYIQDGADTGFTNLYSHACQLHEGSGIRLIVVDALHLLTYDLRPVDTRYEESSEITRRLKALATKLKVPVIVLAHLNRGSEIRSDRRPTLDDLRKSGVPENHADLVILLHREDAYEKESPRAGEADLIVAKHRQGPTGTITVAFQGHYSRFVDMAQT